MTLGAEPKKVAIAALLLGVAAYTMYTNVLSPSEKTPGVEAAAHASIPALDLPRESAEATAGARPQTAASSVRRRGGATVQEWTPALKPKNPADRPNPATVDPKLRVDLLAKLQGATFQGNGERSLFEFSAAPPPKAPDAIIKPGKGGAAPKDDKDKPPEIAGSSSTPALEVKTPPPPIPLKFYGFVNGDGGKRAFFLNGDEIFAASEGELVQKRFKVIRIGVTSAEVEDTQHDHKQSLRLEEPPANPAG